MKIRILDKFGEVVKTLVPTRRTIGFIPQDIPAQPQEEILGIHQPEFHTDFDECI